MAKDIIKLIWNLAEDIKKNPKIRDKISVVYLEDYNVSTAEVLMPASDISEQISMAGKEASGTGCMKFMINGALTIGTLDGANVEMKDAVGDDNIFIFGLNAKEVDELWEKGYRSLDYYAQSARIRKTVDRLNRGFNGVSFSNIANYLIGGYGVSDPYMCLADFDSYYVESDNIIKAYNDKERWGRMSLINIAQAGFFAADRSIKEYAENIWDIKSVK
jgi:starch phosphorylase